MITHEFRRSSYCHNSGCVEVSALADGTIAVRDSKDLTIPHHVYTKDEWAAFISGVKNGEFDLDTTAELPVGAVSA